MLLVTIVTLSSTLTQLSTCQLGINTFTSGTYSLALTLDQFSAYSACFWQCRSEGGPFLSISSPTPIRGQLEFLDGYQFDHTWPPWYAALLVCSASAALVGGMLSICLCPCVNSYNLAPLTFTKLEVRLYIRIVNICTTRSCSSVNSSGTGIGSETLA